MNSFEGDLLEEFASSIAVELLNLLPKLLVMLIVAFLVLRLGGRGIRKLLEIANLDGLIDKYLGVKLPFSLNGVFLTIFYLGVVLALVYGLINLFLGRPYIELANSVMIYGARIMSIIFLVIILFVAFSTVIDKIRVESRMRGYLFFIITLLLTAMLIDVTALSEPVKQSLYTGLAIGIGASLAVFSAWFFFHEYLDKSILEKAGEKKKK
ncbi:MAG: hypothetical protein NZ918_01915 [Aigarchaeota archaeon]|nr:hypothetical protein [Aigarchaeota archaeon]